MVNVKLHSLHASLFTISLPSIPTLMFTYAFIFQCEYFPLLRPNCLYANVYIESSMFAYYTVYNYSPQYTDFAVYIPYLLE